MSQRLERAGTESADTDWDLTVLTNLYKFRVPRNNTDWEYPAKWLLLPQYIDGVEVVPDDSLLSAVVNNSLYLVVRAMDRFLTDPHDNRLSLLLRQSCYIPKSEISGVDLILTHAHYPWNLSNSDIPIVLDTGFMTGEYHGVVGSAERDTEITVKRMLADRATLVTVSSREAAERLKSAIPEYASKIRVLPFFLPSLSAASLDAAGENQSARPIEMLFVGRDGRRKGLSKVVDALWILEDQQGLSDDLSMVFVTEDRVPRLPDTLSVTHYSRLPHERVMELMRASQIFVLPTQKDAYGLVYVEAMASGCAILADRKQPRPEILADGRAGLCCDASDAVAVARGLYRLLYDEGLRSSLAENAIERFRAVYSPEAVSKHLTELIRDALRIHAEK